MKYALFTVSAPTMTLDELAPKIHELGYDGIEFRVVDEAPNPPGMGFWHGNKATVPVTGFAEQVDSLKKLASDNKLEIPNLGTYVNCLDEWDKIEEAFTNAVALGVPSLRINAPAYSPDKEAMPLWNKGREAYAKIAEHAKEKGVRALIEMHMNTVTPSASAARMFLDGLDPKHVGVIYDNGNMVYEGYEQFRLGLELLGDYLAYVHIKNAKWFPVKYREDKSVIWEPMFAAVHEGQSDITALCRALLDVDYDGWIAFEDFSAVRPLPDRLKGNINYVKGVFEKLNSER